jgi:hypothetical protein
MTCRRSLNTIVSACRRVRLHVHIDPSSSGPVMLPPPSGRTAAPSQWLL